MTRREVQRLVEEFCDRGGTVIICREGAVTVDWSDTPVRQALRRMGRNGARKRGQWITRRNLAQKEKS